MSAQDPWEELALGTIAAAIGVEIEHWDCDGRQGVPDGRFIRGRRAGFVEVTTDAKASAWSGRAAYNERVRWQVDGVTFGYHVSIDPTIPREEHDRFVPILIELLDRAPDRSLLDLLDAIEHDQPELFNWSISHIESRRLEIHPSNTTSPGTVFTTAAIGRGGRMESDPDSILDGAASTMRSPHVKKRLDKLKSTGDSEQHLFVRIDNDVWPWPAWHQLVNDECSDIPTDSPTVPDHLDGLWLWSSLNRSCLGWTRSSGWAWQPIVLPPGMSWR